ncbi:hypothetical protein PVK06_039138 [Gossypium arboreum]|uniref:Uncharacterized protein n=1 Tax=Gossypium arboreum TaxID=29729 RepID=A0ABR0N221_GOSAR|nr:hypothetical protein PVK06_039138 [Gossypium arboreum]
MEKRRCMDYTVSSVWIASSCLELQHISKNRCYFGIGGRNFEARWLQSWYNVYYVGSSK